MGQHSLVLSQKTWFRVKDLDDCWVMTIIQGVFAVCPWLRLPSVEAVRKWAGDPDDGVNDGGNIKEILAGIRNGWPEIGIRSSPHRGIEYSTFKNIVDSGRGFSVALMPGKLNKTLQHGVNDVPHQVYIALEGEDWLFFNPWADTPSRPDKIGASDVRAAILEYGNGKVYGVSFPTEKEMLPYHPAYKSTLESSTKNLIAAARIEGYDSGYSAAIAAASGIANDAENKILALRP